jgi:hypothetical protein
VLHQRLAVMMLRLALVDVTLGRSQKGPEELFEAGFSVFRLVTGQTVSGPERRGYNFLPGCGLAAMQES